ncbi:MAG: glycosyltransferase family 2 protein [Bacteroidetes bacterium]|nr:glycosyltransferase family 2 protein [Bacteroidota bacterium]
MTPDYRNSKIFVALPVLDEFDFIKDCVDCINRQIYRNFELFVCVNQQEDWWQDNQLISICENNQRTIEWLQNQKNLPLTIIDKSSKGTGWIGKKKGVGWARKVTMDHINSVAKPNDLIISLDADTSFGENYFKSVINNFSKNVNHVALSIPYYHPITGDKQTDRDILRYEIYMRYYSLNLWRIKNPFNYTALGSAIALPIWAYNKIDGISPRKSGEDFYFLMKLRKFGKIGLWNKEKVYPAARYSSRVDFGTGPAMIKGRSGDWNTYPIYDYKLFDDVSKSYEAFFKLYNQDLDYPMKSFLIKQFKDEKWTEPLLKNNKTQTQFVKACQHKVDGLRILQFLKSSQNSIAGLNEDRLNAYLRKFHNIWELTNLGFDNERWSFDNSSIDELNILRNFLVQKEEAFQQNDK